MTRTVGYGFRPPGVIPLQICEAHEMVNRVLISTRPTPESRMVQTDCGHAGIMKQTSGTRATFPQGLLIVVPSKSLGIVVWPCRRRAFANHDLPLVRLYEAWLARLAGRHPSARPSPPRNLLLHWGAGTGPSILSVPIRRMVVVAVAPSTVLLAHGNAGAAQHAPVASIA